MISVIEREPTPNPNAFKYHTDTQLLTSGALSFSSAAEAGQFHLAKALFDLGNVDAVLIQDDFVSISADEWSSWGDIETALNAELAHFNRERAQELADEAAKAAEEKKANAEPNELLDEINKIIDQYVRPALAGDGGGLEIIGLDNENKELTIRYQGACGSCPTATMGTLQAIEGLLKNKLDPQITIVAG